MSAKCLICNEKITMDNLLTHKHPTEVTKNIVNAITYLATKEADGQ